MGGDGERACPWTSVDYEICKVFISTIYFEEVKVIERVEICAVQKKDHQYSYHSWTSNGMFERTVLFVGVYNYIYQRIGLRRPKVEMAKEET